MKTKKLINIKKNRTILYELYLPNVIEYTPEVKISKHKHHSIYIHLHKLETIYTTSVCMLI